MFLGYCYSVNLKVNYLFVDRGWIDIVFEVVEYRWLDSWEDWGFFGEILEIMIRGKFII